MSVALVHVAPLFVEETNPSASPVVLVQSGAKSGWRPYGAVWLMVVLERMNAPYTELPIPVANVGIEDAGHWHVALPRSCAAPQVVPLSVEFDHATFVTVQEVRLVPPVALQP